MKILSGLLFLAGYACAQTPGTAVRRDSLPLIFPPDVVVPNPAPTPMPNLRPNNSFYRYQLDPANVMRATLDNMPIKIPDSSTYYTMLRSRQQPYRFLPQPPMLPIPQIPQPPVPRKR